MPAFAKGPADYELLVNQMGSDADFEKKPWAEVEHQLPKLPEEANLVPIDINSLSRNQFFVDELSVTYGADEAIRYTLVVVSPQGARNVSYEGLRCATIERRLYAFGRADGSWSKARDSKWVRIENKDLNRHHAALYADYFCPSGSAMVWNTESARKMLRAGSKRSVLP